VNNEELLDDLEKLVGLTLPSIRPGAEVHILVIDREAGRLTLRTSSGEVKSRPLSEITRIWQHLCDSAAVHVDSVLAGSGSSRNQPETILANLPSVEWLMVGGTKHLSLADKSTHPYGTLKRMDSIRTQRVRERMSASQNHDGLVSRVVVASHDIGHDAKRMEAVTGLPFEPVEPGVYRQLRDGVAIYLVATDMQASALKPGTYPVVAAAQAPSGCSRFRLENEELYVLRDNAIQVLISVPSD
jgi:hypothetical protein